MAWPMPMGALSTDPTGSNGSTSRAGESSLFWVECRCNPEGIGIIQPSAAPKAFGAFHDLSVEATVRPGHLRVFPRMLGMFLPLRSIGWRGEGRGEVRSDQPFSLDHRTLQIMARKQVPKGTGNYAG